MLAISKGIQDSIKQLCVERYYNPGDFVEFTDKLLSLGVIRQTYDVLQNGLIFYSKDAVLYHLPVSEVDSSIDESSFDIGDSLDLTRIKSAIQNFDEDKLSVNEFHHEVACAGIVYVSVHLNQRTIYYLSQDGKYFLETY
ncbi:DUF1398 family protein [Legionella impletisoli]|uniref:Phage envelope protein n=1 Tax=Legionella impletisoli TaxID=343510 RepID=A0A917JQW5_9GAMM|nr:DUF1398 family protein [Legionella impletisoli]GGI78121.1 hypothetical protein GCM10007966_03530 [Legionella impletisoli]